MEDRRSAVSTLAGILEERRTMLKAQPLRDDEAVLFQIANRFHIANRFAIVTKGMRSPRSLVTWGSAGRR